MQEIITRLILLLEKIKKISGETENIIEKQISKISENQKNREVNLLDI